VAEYDRALTTAGVTKEEVKAFLEANPRYASPLHKPPHVYAGGAADIVAEVAPFITESRTQRLKGRLLGTAKATAKVATESPEKVKKMLQGAVTAAPTVAAKVKEDLILLQETRKAAKAKKHAAANDQASAQAAE
jgi:hypothetical protein